MTDESPTLAPAGYRFRSAWTVPDSVTTEPRRVYDLLEDVSAYPTWWRSVPAVGRLAEDVALVLCRSRLPKTLHLELRPLERDRERQVLRARLDGDLAGWSEFLLQRGARGGVQVRYRQEVDTRGPLLAWAGRLARPLLEWNHEQMMRALRHDLAAALSA